MKFRPESADASFYFHEDAASDVARMDTAAVSGNYSDAMKNATVLIQNVEIAESIEPFDTVGFSDIQK